MLKLKDNYDEQMGRLRALCEVEGLADREVSITLTFTYQGSRLTGQAGTGDMKKRVEAALKEFGLTYTMIQDPGSTYLNPVFVVFLAGPTRDVLGFYEAIGDQAR